jgi:hypothetical protein
VNHTAFKERTDCRICGDPGLVGDLCNRHYLRALRHGDPKAGGSERRGVLANVIYTQHGWEWVGAKHRVHGIVYGRYNHETAHRVIYRLFVGPIPADDDYVVDHLPACPKTCVTPTHLRLLRRGDHTRLGFARGEIGGGQIWQ